MGICNQRTVVITGAGGGLGRAYALAFAQEGANVVVNDIRAEAAQAVADEVVAAGGKALANTGDITTVAGAQSILDATVAAFGDVNIIVNNAGVLRDRMFLSLSEEDWDMVMRVHLRGHFCMAKVFGGYWRDQKKAGKDVDARIINTSSGAGLQGSIGQSNYAAAKAGIIGFSKSLAKEIGSRGVTVNVVAPGFIATDMTADLPDAAKEAMLGQIALGRLGAPADIARAVAFLAGPGATYITGETLHVNGGMYMP